MGIEPQGLKPFAVLDNTDKESGGLSLKAWRDYDRASEPIVLEIATGGAARRIELQPSDLIRVKVTRSVGPTVEESEVMLGRGEASERLGVFVTNPHWGGGVSAERAMQALRAIAEAAGCRFETEMGQQAQGAQAGASASAALLTERARALGPIAEGEYRVLVIESNASVSHQDFRTLEEARAYADDAASEAGADERPIAKVLGPNFELLHDGKPYWLK
jgi:hypothetical protein